MKKRNFRIAFVSAVTAGMLAIPTTDILAQGLPARIKLGSSQPLTGVAAANGIGAKVIQEMTVKEINAAGGIAGRPVDLAYGDDASDPTKAVTEAKRLIDQEKVHVLMGPGVAAVALATAPIVTQAKMLSFPFSGTKAINPQSFPYGFSPFYSSDAFLEALVDFAVDKLKAKNIGLMVDTGGQGKASADIAREYIPKRGAKITGIEAADFDATDYTPQVLNLKRGNPDVVIQVTSYQQGVAFFYKATEEQGWKVPIVGQNSSNFPVDVVKMVGPNAYAGRRMIGLTPRALTYCPGEDVSRNAFVQFREKVKAYTPNWQKIVNPIAPAYYDQLYLIKAAIEATRSVDGPVLADWIEKNAGSVKAVIGKFTPSKTDHFLYHSDIFAFTVRPDQTNAQGLAVREGC